MCQRAGFEKAERVWRHGDAMFYPCYVICNFDSVKAIAFLSLPNSSASARILSNRSIHAYEMDYFKPGKYTSMFADTGEYSKESFSRNFEKSYVEWLKNSMEENVFDFVRNTEEWNDITK